MTMMTTTLTMLIVLIKIMLIVIKITMLELSQYRTPAGRAMLEDWVWSTRELAGPTGLVLRDTSSVPRVKYFYFEF